MYHKRVLIVLVSQYVVSLSFFSPVVCNQKVRSRNNDRFTRNSLISANVHRVVVSSDTFPPPLRMLHSDIYHTHTRQSRSSHVRFNERRVRMLGIARFVARVPTTAARPSRSLARFPSHARCLPRVPLHPASRYSQRSAGTAAAPRAHRLDEPSAGTIWAPTATPPLSFSLPFLSRLPTLLWPRRRPQPVASRRLGVFRPFFVSSSLCGYSVAHNVPLSPLSPPSPPPPFRAHWKTRRLKADVCANPNDLIACHAARCVEASFFLEPDDVSTGTHAALYECFLARHRVTLCPLF